VIDEDADDYDFAGLAPMMFPERRTAFDVDISVLGEKPWRRPGVDLNRYFNYGLTERSWRIDLRTNPLKFYKF